MALYSADMVPATSPTEPPALGLDAPKKILEYIEGALLTVHRKDGCCQQNNIDVQ